MAASIGENGGSGLSGIIGIESGNGGRRRHQRNENISGKSIAAKAAWQRSNGSVAAAKIGNIMVA